MIRARWLFVIAAVLSAFFLVAAAILGAFNLPLAALILTYTFLPVTVAYLARSAPPPTWTDFVIIALLWFPLEFSLGHQFIPKQAQSRLHLAAYGVSILLGLSIFLLFRRLKGMKFNLPRSGHDFVNLLIGFAACALVLIPLGRAIGFLPGHILWFILGEAMLIAAIGGVLGVLVAYPVIEKGLGRWLEENMGTFFPYFRIPPIVALVAVVLAVGLGVVAAAIPAYRASQLRVIDALRRVA